MARVYLGRWKGKKVAVKMLLRKNLSEDAVRAFEKEAKIMSYLHHPNVCALVVEWLEHGSLWNLLESSRIKLSATLRASIVGGIARGMQYLHGLRILHRNLKRSNVLLERDFSVKISNFRLARVKAVTQIMTGNCGTVQWMAPEMLGILKYTEKADVFSFGIVMWEIFSGCCPYDGMTEIQVAQGVLNDDLRPTIPASCPRFLARLMQMCWARDPVIRPSFAIIVDLLEQHERACEAVAGAQRASH